VIALASGIAFAVSEMVDWALFTFTKYRLSTRILLSSLVASPVDTSIFLYGADLAVQMRLGEEPGSMLHAANWIVFFIGKMVGAVIVSAAVRRREDAGEISPAAL
ncbi:MAG: VUT family protein, partial [Pseudomonadota bacterium]